MKTKIIAFIYKIPELQTIHGNEFLELSLQTLEEEVNSLLEKYPEKRDLILQEAQIAKQETIKLQSTKAETIRQTITKKQTLEEAITRKKAKLGTFQEELTITIGRLATLHAELDKIPSYQAKIEQIKAKISLLKKLGDIFTNYPQKVQSHLINHCFNEMIEISENTKEFYRKTSSLKLTAPFLSQFTKEDLLKLFENKDLEFIETNLINENEDAKDYILMILVYLERHITLELTHRDIEQLLTDENYTKQQISDAIKKLFGDNKHLWIDFWSLMRPIEEWSGELQSFRNIIYDGLVTRDLIGESIYKARNRKQISEEDVHQIAKALKSRKNVEVGFLLRLSIQLLIKTFLNLLHSESVKEVKELARLDNAVKAAQKNRIAIPAHLLEDAEIGKEYSIDIIKNYYPKIIGSLTKYADIVYTQALVRFNTEITPYLENIATLITASNIELEELEKTQIGNKELQEQKERLNDKIKGLDLIINSLTNEIIQNETTVRTLETTLTSDSQNDDELYPKADAIRNRLVRVITKPPLLINEDAPIKTTPTSEVTETLGIPINNIKLWQELKADTIYWVRNDKNIRTYVCFSKRTLEEVATHPEKDFLSALKKGEVVSKTATNGIKYMKEREENYEIKLVGTAWRIFGKLQVIDGNEVIVFNKFKQH